MIGWRGASRYYDEKYSDAFALECAAVKRVRSMQTESGLAGKEDKRADGVCRFQHIECISAT